MNASITDPTFLVNRSTCRANIRRMAEKAAEHNLILKPHFKTHQSAEIGSWFRDFGVDAITVSSVDMAEFFYGHGWRDITIAFPVYPGMLDRLNELAGRIELTLFMNSEEMVALLDQKLSSDVSAYIEIDTGNRRSGIDPGDLEAIGRVVESLSDSARLKFHGFYTHPGHSYSARTKEEVHSIYEQVRSAMNELKAEFEGNGTGPLRCCIGDTPCCSVANRFDGVDEISPGNFVYYDLMQVQIGSCTMRDIAVALAAPVAAKRRDRNEIIIHGGAVHVSKESLSWNNREIYGLPVMLENQTWEPPEDPGESYLKSISQEHGVLACGDTLFDRLQVGDTVGILPVHSCLSANLMKGLKMVDVSK